METYLHIQSATTGPRYVNYVGEESLQAITVTPQGHEHYNPQKKNYIFMRQVTEEMKAKAKKR